MYKKIKFKKIDSIEFIESNSIIKIEGNIQIPFDEKNKDYQEYLVWLSEGNTPLEAD